jgi:hypothetical protein
MYSGSTNSRECSELVGTWWTETAHQVQHDKLYRTMGGLSFEALHCNFEEDLADVEFHQRSSALDKPAAFF